MKQLFPVLVMLFSTAILYPQDLIALKKGETINGKVAEVGINEIRYYKSDNPHGPVHVTSKVDVTQIVYAKGTKDVFKTHASQPGTQNKGILQAVSQNFYRLYIYPINTPHIDLGHHRYSERHHQGGHQEAIISRNKSGIR